VLKDFQERLVVSSGLSGTGAQFACFFWYKSANTDAAHPHFLLLLAQTTLLSRSFTGTKAQILTQKYKILTQLLVAQTTQLSRSLTTVRESSDNRSDKLVDDKKRRVIFLHELIKSTVAKGVLETSKEVGIQVKEGHTSATSAYVCIRQRLCFAIT
jgi:hypothetical protein